MGFKCPLLWCCFVAPTWCGLSHLPLNICRKSSEWGENLAQQPKCYSFPAPEKSLSPNLHPRNEKPLSYESIISTYEGFTSLKSMESNKSPWGDGLSKKFYESFWDETKKLFLTSIYKASLNLVVINLLDKRKR